MEFFFHLYLHSYLPPLFLLTLILFPSISFSCQPIFVLRCSLLSHRSPVFLTRLKMPKFLDFALTFLRPSLRYALPLSSADFLFLTEFFLCSSDKCRCVSFDTVAQIVIRPAKTPPLATHVEWVHEHNPQADPLAWLPSSTALLSIMVPPSRPCPHTLS